MKSFLWLHFLLCSVLGDIQDIFSSVNCSYGSLTVTLNPYSSLANATVNQNDFAIVVPDTWTPGATPLPLCSAVFGSAHTQPATFNFTNCNVTVVEIIGYQGYINSYYVQLNLIGYPITLSPIFSFPVSCTFPAQALTNGTGVTAKNPWDPNNGGGGKTDPQLRYRVLSSTGSQINSAYVGASLEFVVFLDSLETTYAALMPEICYFSANTQWDTSSQARLMFIDGGCPRGNLPTVIKSSDRINRTYYRTQFTAFQLSYSSNAMEYLYVHCQVKLCIEAAKCTQTCWGTNNEKEPQDQELGATEPNSFYPITVPIQMISSPESTTIKIAVDGGETSISSWILILLYAVIGCLAAALFLCSIYVCFVAGRKQFVYTESGRV